MDRLDVGAVYCQVWEGCPEQDFRDEEARLSVKYQTAEVKREKRVEG